VVRVEAFLATRFGGNVSHAASLGASGAPASLWLSVGGFMAIVDGLLCILTFVTALGCGLIAGLFFAFSVAVMQALGRLPPAGGIAAMQSINSTILNPLFLSVFLGTAAGCALVMIIALARWHSPGSVYSLVGGTLYLVGSLLVTVVCNVPKNEALAAVAPADPDGANLWAGYLTSWTTWNHVRTVASLAAASSLIIGLC
jgi:uncharacterized membrane protein